MFKWRNKSSKTLQEPKTPRLQNIPLLPDTLYVPRSYHQQSYDPNPYSNYPQAPARQAMTPMVDPRYSRREPTSRSRTMSTPNRELKGMLDDHLLYFFFDLYMWSPNTGLASSFTRSTRSFDQGLEGEFHSSIPRSSFRHELTFPWFWWFNNILLVPSAAFLEEVVQKKATELPIPISISSKYRASHLSKRWSNGRL